ncbi:MAG: hypothetical protein ACI9RO_000220 [Alteromonas macleodii]|jgi:hypothetical protein|tara:strand:- start:137 stop:403 length:267 start_codon:yes stop_codon:yes gene_type:complete
MNDEIKSKPTYFIQQSRNTPFYYINQIIFNICIRFLGCVQNETDIFLTLFPYSKTMALKNTQKGLIQRLTSLNFPAKYQLFQERFYTL